MIQRPVDWRPVPGYEGLYSVTRDGRVWAHERQYLRNGRTVTVPPRWLRPRRLGRYLGVMLYQKSTAPGVYLRKNCYLHHLVMAAWGPAAPSPEHEIDHDDRNRHHNAISNLNWATQQQNLSQRGLLWITDGIQAKRRRESDPIPEGWWSGRPNRQTKPQSENRAASRQRQ